VASGDGRRDAGGVTTDPAGTVDAARVESHHACAHAETRRDARSKAPDPGPGITTVDVRDAQARGDAPSDARDACLVIGLHVRNTRNVATRRAASGDAHQPRADKRRVARRYARRDTCADNPAACRANHPAD
jgi:hypothetical protein